MSWKPIVAMRYVSSIVRCWRVEKGLSEGILGVSQNRSLSVLWEVDEDWMLSQGLEG